MRIALISDIHGNIYALEAVLRDLKKEKPDLTVFLGDLAYGGLYPSECLGTVGQIEPLLSVKDNADGKFDEVDNGGDNKGIKKHILEIHRWGRERLSAEEIGTIRNIPFSRSLETDGFRLGFWHGSPQSYNDRIYSDDEPELISGFFKKETVDLAAVGNTHVRMDQSFGPLRIINPGAVGISNDGDTRAAFGILDISKGQIFYTQHNIDYPEEKYGQEVKAGTMPWAAVIAEQLQTGEPNKPLFRPLFG